MLPKRTIKISRTAHYHLWMTVGRIVTILSLWIGGGFAIRGDSIAGTINYETLNKAPGGLHTYGAILVVLGLAVFYVMHTKPMPNPLACWVFRVYTFFGLFVGMTFVFSWVDTGSVEFGGPIWFFALAAIVQALSMFSPKICSKGVVR